MSRKQDGNVADCPIDCPWCHRQCHSRGQQPSLDSFAAWNNHRLEVSSTMTSLEELSQSGNTLTP
jgi:hypothetical protein